MTEEIRIPVEVADKLKGKFTREMFSYGCIPTDIERIAHKIIDSMTEPEFKYKAGDGRKYKWSGESRSSFHKARYGIKIKEVNATVNDEYPYKLTNDWWVAESSLTEIEPVEELPEKLTPEQNKWIKEEFRHCLGNCCTDPGDVIDMLTVPIPKPKPVEEPEFKFNDFMCFKDDNKHIIYRNYQTDPPIWVERYIDGICIRVEKRELRHAKDSDWIVMDENGTKWTAEYDIDEYIQVRGNTVYLRPVKRMIKTEHNKIMGSICEDKNIPIKPYKED
ncbi:MAG TPA: hypothetical protein ENH82_19580 [bacterium]|nr:hypothetical protein [bacterium]